MFGFGKKKKNGPVSLEEAGFSVGRGGVKSNALDGLENASITNAKGSQSQVKQIIQPEMSEGVHARRIPKYIEAWGWAAASAKFRGLLVVILGFVLCCGSVALLMTNAMLAKKNYIVVGMYPDGNPVVLEQMRSFEPGPELFVRHFASKFLNYSGQTVGKNMSEAMSMSTTGFKQSWEHRFGRDFVASVTSGRIVQVTSINRVEIKNLDARRFTAEVWSLRYRNAAVSNETKEERLKYEIDVFRGDPTIENPWGLFVNAIRESTY